jgi:TPR repeat protein
VNWYKKAVDLGKPIAMVDLGYQYENGHGVKKDCAEAVRLYETAVKAGILAAMNNLGLLYLHGKCVSQRLCRGAPPDGARQRAGQRCRDERHGRDLQRGRRVPRNVKVARQWFEKAAALGNPEAKQNLPEMGR